MSRERRGGDLKRYRAIIDALDGDFATEAKHAEKTGQHLADGSSGAATWISRT